MIEPCSDTVSRAVGAEERSVSTRVPIVDNRAALRHDLALYLAPLDAVPEIRQMTRSHAAAWAARTRGGRDGI